VFLIFNLMFHPWNNGKPHPRIEKELLTCIKCPVFYSYVSVMFNTERSKYVIILLCMSVIMLAGLCC
jgi:hypothetical protein